MDKPTQTQHIWDLVKDTSEEMFHKQQELWMKNSSENRLAMTLAFTDSGLELNKAGLRNENPSWTDEQVFVQQVRELYKHDFSPEVLEEILIFLQRKK